MGGRSPGFAMDYEELLGRGSSKEPVSDLVEEDEAFLMFTGGDYREAQGGNTHAQGPTLEHHQRDH